MILLSDLFNNLSHGELVNINLGGNSTTGIINSGDWARIVSHVNLALTAIHQRFLLRTGQAVIQQHEGITRYYLRSEFADTNTESTEPIKYLKDSTDNPFQDDVLKIEAVYDELGYGYRINDSTADLPIYTPEYDCLDITPSEINPAWFVIYRADYPKIILNETFDPSTVKIHIPNYLHEPLQAYTVYRLLSGMTSNAPERTEGGAYFARYEFLCKQIEMKNMDADDNDIYNRLEANGWV